MDGLPNPEKEKVVFRAFKNGRVVALFPEWHAPPSLGRAPKSMSYGPGETIWGTMAKRNEWRERKYHRVMKQTRQARPDEYANLKAEIEREGYLEHGVHLDIMEETEAESLRRPWKYRLAVISAILPLVIVVAVRQGCRAWQEEADRKKQEELARARSQWHAARDPGLPWSEPSQVSTEPGQQEDSDHVSKAAELGWNILAKITLAGTDEYWSWPRDQRKAYLEEIASLCEKALDECQHADSVSMREEDPELARRFDDEFRAGLSDISRGIETLFASQPGGWDRIEQGQGKLLSFSQWLMEEAED